jgi:hypothetical protein
MTLSVGLNFVLTLLITNKLRDHTYTVACFDQINAFSAKMVHLIETTIVTAAEKTIMLFWKKISKHD